MPEIDFVDGKLNAAYNAIERHTTTWRRNKVALYHRSADSVASQYTFKQINDKANQFANVLHRLEIKKKERVFFFLTSLNSTF